MSVIAQRIAKVQSRLLVACEKADRCPKTVQILPVSKFHSIESMQEMILLGWQAFAENQLQAAMKKKLVLSDPAIQWHFIGSIQTNKIKNIAAEFNWLHSLAAEAHALKLAQQRHASQEPLDICIQVNISGEQSKSGVSLSALYPLAKLAQSLPSLRLRGLMTIPAISKDSEQQRKYFHQLRVARDELEQKLATKLDTLSMGMSMDMEAAILEGATIIRVGTAIFGPRDQI